MAAFLFLVSNTLLGHYPPGLLVYASIGTIYNVGSLQNQC